MFILLETSLALCEFYECNLKLSSGTLKAGAVFFAICFLGHRHHPPYLIPCESFFTAVILFL
jgi:hypothetical protein